MDTNMFRPAGEVTVGDLESFPMRLIRVYSCAFVVRFSPCSTI